MARREVSKEAVAQLRESGLFDEAWYLAQHPDVQLLGMDAAEHYLAWGAWLGRDPGPGFDTAYYLQQAPGAAASGLAPPLHYLRIGRASGLRPVPGAAPAPGSPTPAAAPAPPEPMDWSRPLGEHLHLIREAFDEAFYRLHFFEPSTDPATDPFEHFMSVGWREGYDPSPDFDLSYYLRQSPDIARSAINPFSHYVLAGRREKRRSRPSRMRYVEAPFLPKVSVIVPNYNHARYLRQRLDSILGQTWSELEVIVLDDASTDDSREVIESYCRDHPQRVRAIYNEANSGGVFRQWKRGLAEATGELVWVCESDDWCEADFLARLVPHFKDRSVQLAFGRIQFCDEAGALRPGLDAYRENAEPGIWNAPKVRPAAEWFARGFGVNNLIANVGGCVWRRQAIPAAVWAEVDSLRVLGDWWLYLELAGGGQIAYEPTAVAYFRQHGQNTSVRAFHAPPYYVEHQRFMRRLKRRWDIPAATVERFLASIEHQYRHFGVAKVHGPFERHVDRAALLAQPRTEPHVLLAMLSFTAGGGEVLPLNLGNELRAQGCLVSVLVVRQEGENAEMRDRLDSGIAVYYAEDVLLAGVDVFMQRAGVSLVHSHMVSCESELLGGRMPLSEPLPYLVTLHGSYEATGVPESRIALFARKVSHWAWTTLRNLEPFANLGLPAERFSRVNNGMPVDPRPFPETREALGLEPDTVVFTLVARGIERKGWRASTAAFRRVRDANPGRRMALLLCGDGPVADREREQHGDDPDIRFLGYQNRISGLYRLSDCALLPTRFAGESFPLALIQALHVGTPAIATRIGEIPAMIESEGRAAGLLIEPVRDTEAFLGQLAQAMERMLDDGLRRRFGQAALRIGGRYAMEAVAGEYRGLYQTLLPPGMQA
jgi:glycosyltransferase involved in cell wall biosynthesis